jgi:hypothetical protein
MKVNLDQIAKSQWESGAMWEFEGEGGILQVTMDYATKRATYEVIDYDEATQDWITQEVISKAEAEKYWTIPEVLYS